MVFSYQSLYKLPRQQIQSSDPEVFKELASINQSMMDMMATKLDAVIDKLDSSNNTQSKILKYSKA